MVIDVCGIDRGGIEHEDVDKDRKRVVSEGPREGEEGRPRTVQDRLGKSTEPRKLIHQLLMQRCVCVREREGG